MVDYTTNDDWEEVAEGRAQRNSSPSHVIRQHHAKHIGGPHSGVAVCQETGRTFEYHDMNVVPTLCRDAYEAKVRRDHNLGGQVAVATRIRGSRRRSSDSNPLAWIILGAVPASLVLDGIGNYFKSHGISDIFQYIQHCINSCY